MKIWHNLSLLSIGVRPLGMSYLIVMVCGIVGTTVWARLMPQEIFGQFKVVLAVLGVISSFCLLGTSQAATMSASKGKDGNLVRLLRSKLLANVGGGLAILGAAAYYAWGPNRSEPVATGLLIAAFMFPLYNTSDIWMAWLNGKSKFQTLSNGRSLTSLLTLTTILSLGLLGVVDLWVIIFVYVFVLSAQNVLMLRKVLQFRVGSVKDDKVIRLGRHVSLTGLFGSLMALDVIVLHNYFSAVDVAIYSIAILFPLQMKGIFAIFNQTLAPGMYRSKSLEELWMNFRGQFVLLTAGFVTIAIIGFFLLPSITTLLFSEKYAEAAEYGKWLWLTVGLLSSTAYLGVALTACHSLVTIYASGFVYPICLAGLYFYWVEDGIEGMMTARIIAACGLSAIYVSAFIIILWREKKNARQL